MTQALVVCVTPSGFIWAALLTPLVILLSAIVALFGVRTARAVARQRATLDMIEKVESTPHYRDLRAVFSYHRRNNTFNRLHNPTENKEAKERQAVLDYLNHYELVSIGICRKILDDEIYKDWMKGPFIRDWNAAAHFIQRERWKWDSETREWTYYDRLFASYGAVSSMWSPEAVILTKDFSGPPAEAAGPGDEKLPKDDDDQPEACAED